MEAILFTCILQNTSVMSHKKTSSCYWLILGTKSFVPQVSFIVALGAKSFFPQVDGCGLAVNSTFIARHTSYAF